MKHFVTIEGSGERFACPEDLHVLAAMEQSRCRGIPVGCRNGGCGACKVCVTAGRYETRKMNRVVVSEAEQAAGCVLACRIQPRSDLSVRVLGRHWQPARPTPSPSPGPGLPAATSMSRPPQET